MDLVGLGAPAFKFHAISEVGLDRLDASGERRIGQAAGHGAPDLALRTPFDHKAGVGGCAAMKAGDDQERAAALDLGVAGVNLDLGSVGLPTAARAAEGRGANLHEH